MRTALKKTEEESPVWPEKQNPEGEQIQPKTLWQFPYSEKKPYCHETYFYGVISLFSQIARLRANVSGAEFSLHA